MKKHKQKHLGAICYLVAYMAFNLMFLITFPTVHSDESWLGGLSRNMLASGSLSCTEPFFTAKPRFPHALKSLFHLLQQGAIKLMGYTPFALRFLSLLAAVGCLFVFYRCALRLFERKSLAVAAMILMSVDIQFIYAGHFARSEIFLLLLLCLCLYALAAQQITTKTVLACALATGVGVFFHPNAFFLACGCGSAILAYTVWERKTLRHLILYCVATGAIAALAVGISYGMDSKFLPHYFRYGAQEFDVMASPGQKITDIFGFFGRLWQQESGTYYLPNIRVQLVIGAFCMLLCTVFVAAMHREEPRMSRFCWGLLCAEMGLLGGIAIVGRLNQTSIVFLLPVAVLLCGFGTQLFSQRYAAQLLTVLLCVSAIGSIWQIVPVIQGPSYSDYLQQLAAVVPRNAKTVANLNTGFYFDNDALLDYRNLPYAAENGGLADFLRKSDVEYILYSDELDYLYENRPYYNVIYGNPMFVEQLREFCVQNCVEVASFTNAVYGKRINVLQNNDAYGHITVYRVKE